MNNSDIVEKLTIIESIMNFQTRRYYEENKRDIYFDMFVCCNEEEQNAVYVLEIKNGLSNIEKKKKYYTDFFISSGVHLEVEKQININNITDSQLAPRELNRIIHLAMDASKNDDNTIGGQAYIALMENDGNITTYINEKCHLHKGINTTKHLHKTLYMLLLVYIIIVMNIFLVI